MFIKLKSIIAMGVFLSLVFAETISVQGVLRDPQGNTIDEGSYDLTLKLYDQEEGGPAIWQEIQSSIYILHGVFTLDVGSVNPLDSISFTTTYYLGITVADDPEMTPRVKLLKAPSTLSVSGAENIVPSIGNVGIGIADPQARLHIVTNELGDDMIKVEDADGKGFRVDSLGNFHLQGGASIKFADGTQLTTANFEEPAVAVGSNVDVTFKSDADGDGTGRLEFIIHDSLQMEISEEAGVSTAGVAIGGSYPGSIAMFAGATAPEGWLLCDGSEYSITEYDFLYEVIGTTYGSGVGTFKVPDLRGRDPMGYDASNTKFDTLGEIGGEETHTLTEEEMPEHYHTKPNANRLTTENGEHNHWDYESYTYGELINDYSYLIPSVWGDEEFWDFVHDEGEESLELDTYANSPGWGQDTYSTVEGHHTHGINLGNQNTYTKGGDTAFNIMHSYLTMNYIIKY